MRFSLNQFQEVFNLRDQEGKPYILIGGQAVNFWAETYLGKQPALNAFLPFVSKDIDFIGNREAVLRTARSLGLQPRLPHRKLMTAFAGAVAFRIGGEEANIEFIHSVPGVPRAKAAAWAASAERGGRSIRVLDPISLTACKLELALTVDQSERRDVDHLKMLLICVRAFLGETMQAVESGALSVRDWLKAVERLLKLADSRMGSKAARAFDMDWRQALPNAEIARAKHSMIARFREKRLLLWSEKINRTQSH